MDTTIIYLYQQRQPEGKKEQQSPELYRREDFEMPDYHLIRVEMSERLLQICQDNCTQEEGRRKEKPGGFFARRRRVKQMQQERQLLASFLREMIRAQAPGEADGVRISKAPDCRLQTGEAQTAKAQESACFVCQEPMPYFAERYFNDYFAEKWVRHMLRYGGYVQGMAHPWGSADHGGDGAEVSPAFAYFVLLGETGCVPDILWEYARGMKSLKWILPQRQFREEHQELVEMLSEEYGLAAEVRLLSEEESYRQVYPMCRFPSLILDFSETDRIPTADVARGSIWLDMASSEDKRRRIEDRDTGIRYFSLKKEWKQPQKALNYLDTMGKNGYNT